MASPMNKPNWRKRKWTPYIAPSDAPPMREVIRQVADGQREIDKLDEDILMRLCAVERKLNQLMVRRLVRVKLADGAELAWSQRNGRWRLVICDEDGAIPVRDVEPDERIDIINSGALEKLCREAGLLAK